MLKTFVSDLIRRLPVGPEATRVAVVVFSNRGSLEFNLDTHTDRASLLAAVDTISYPQGLTNIAEALRIARQEVFVDARPNVKKLVILLTDGMPTVEQNQTIPEARLLKMQDVTIETIGITSMIEFELLERIASNASNVRMVEDFSDLSSVVEQITSEVLCPPSK